GGGAVGVLHRDQRGGGAAVAPGAGDRGQHGGPQVLLQVDPTAEPVVDPVTTEGHQQPEEQAEEGADHGVLLGLGAVGSAGTVGGVDHGARVVDVELGHVGQGLPVGAALVLQ